MRLFLLPLALAAALFVGSVPAARAEEAPAAAAPTLTPEAKAMLAGALTERSLGDAKAPVTLIEYAALTCSHCAHFHLNVLPEIKKNYIDTGKVRIIFREFPFNEVGLVAAMAARCVKPDAYLDFVQSLFTTQDSWSQKDGGVQMLRQMAGFAGLSPNMFDACVADKTLSRHLLEVRVDATNNLQINSTPTFLIDGTLERIVGAQDYSEYAAMIERQLARSKATK